MRYSTYYSYSITSESFPLNKFQCVNYWVFVPKVWSETLRYRAPVIMFMRVLFIKDYTRTFYLYILVNKDGDWKLIPSRSHFLLISFCKRNRFIHNTWVVKIPNTVCVFFFYVGTYVCTCVYVFMYVRLCVHMYTYNWISNLPFFYYSGCFFILKIYNVWSLFFLLTENDSLFPKNLTFL